MMTRKPTKSQNTIVFVSTYTENDMYTVWKRFHKWILTLMTKYFTWMDVEMSITA